MNGISDSRSILNVGSEDLCLLFSIHKTHFVEMDIEIFEGIWGWGIVN